MNGEDRLNLSASMTSLNQEERDACSNVLSSSHHVTLKILPNHHIDMNGELRGYMFTSHPDDLAEVLPINKRMFDMISLYECSSRSMDEGIFHPDAIRMINDIPKYRMLLEEYIQELKASDVAPANFDCINDNDDCFSSHPDQRVWRETVPNTVGVYHAFSRSNTNDRREHKLFIVVSGCLNLACEALQNLWHDCRSQYTCKDILESEELMWLRNATHRNHGRIAAKVASFCDLKVRRVVDTEDPTGTCRMVLPTTFSYKTDCAYSSRFNQARVVDNGCFLDNNSNGILFEMFASEGFWLFRGPRDLSDCKNTFGTQFNFDKTYPCFPTSTLRYHSRFPVRDHRTAVRVATNSCPHVTYKFYSDREQFLFPDENFMKTLNKLGFNRNDGALNLMPIVCYSEKQD